MYLKKEVQSQTEHPLCKKVADKNLKKDHAEKMWNQNG